MKLSARLTLFFFIVAFIPVTVVGYISFVNGKQAIEHNLSEHLTTTVINKQDQLSDWLETSEEKLIAIAQRPLVKDFSAVLMDESADDEAKLHAAQELIEQHFQPNLKDENYISFNLLDPETGRIFLSTNDSMIGKYRDNYPFFIHGKSETFVDDVRYYPSEEEFALHISTPIFDANGTLQAVLVGHLNLEVMSGIMQLGRGVVEEEETYLVNKAYYFVTEPWLGEAKALQSTVRTKGIENCLRGEDGVETYLDYRDLSVIGAYRWIPDNNLCIVTEITESTALQPVYRLRSQILLIGSVSSIILACLGVFMAHSITRPISSLVKGTNAVGSGDYSYIINLKRRDELGELANSFNRMADNLLQMDTDNQRLYQETRAWADELERRVDERTFALRLSEERYRILTEASPDYIFVIDQEDRIQYVNTHAVERMGMSKNQITGKLFSEIFPADISEDQRKNIQSIFETHQTLITESKMQFGETNAWLDMRVVPIVGENDTVTSALVVLRNITDLIQTQEELQRLNENLKNSNAELERFAYVTSHDLQEPLRMVSSYLQLLERRYKDKLDDDAIEFINYAVDGSKRMKDLINDLLAYSRVGTRGKPFEPYDLQEILDDVLFGLKIAIEEAQAVVTHDPMPTIKVDKTQIASLFQNLIGNAIKFCGDQHPVIHIGVKEMETEWEFSVKDNGIGIDPQFFERVFIIFQRLHNREEYEGTGIGLAISKRIVERHHGRIWIESQPGAGTTFFFTLSK